MGKSGSARAKAGGAGYGGAMADHEDRLDFKGTMRKLRDVAPLIYSPHAEERRPIDHFGEEEEEERLRLLKLERIKMLIEVKEGRRNFTLMDAYAAHVEGANRSKGAKELFQHAFLQFPTDLEITPETEIEMLAQGVAFINKTYGGNAVFHARLDRDEAGRHGVDVFFAPRYEKTTAKGVDEWISLSKFSKELARERFGQRQKTVKNKTTGAFDPIVDKAGNPVMVWNDSGYFQGRALQDAFYEHLRDDMGLEWAERGQRKKNRDHDRLEPEEYAAQKEAKSFTAEVARQIKNPSATLGDTSKPETPPVRPYEAAVRGLLTSATHEAQKAMEGALEARRAAVEAEVAEMRREALQELSEARRARLEAAHALDFARDEARMEIEAANLHGIKDYRDAYRDAENSLNFAINGLKSKLETSDKKARLWEGSFQILVAVLKALLPESTYQAIKQRFDPELTQLKESLDQPPAPSKPSTPSSGFKP